MARWRGNLYCIKRPLPSRWLWHCWQCSRRFAGCHLVAEASNPGRLKFRDAALKLRGNFVRIRIRRETKRLTNGHSNLAWRRRDAILLFQIEEPLKAHGNDGNVQLFGKETDARAKHEDASVYRRLAFRKDQNIPATIREIAGKRETFQEAGLLGQWKYVEKRQRQKIVEAFVETSEQVHLFGRAPHSG